MDDAPPGHVARVFAWHRAQELNASGEAAVYAEPDARPDAKKRRAPE